MSKYYYGVLTKSLSELEIERYFSIVYYIHFNKKCTQQQICDNMGVDKTAMVKVLGYLKKAGYISSHVNPNDRREHFIGLTALGKSKTKKVIKAFNTLDLLMFKEVSKKEKETFIKVMGKVTALLANLPAEELFFDYKYQAKK